MVFNIFKSFFEVPNVSSSAEDFSNGLGQAVNWKKFREALTNRSGYPIMVVVHASKCKSCDFFRTWFSGSDEIRKLSENFEMVNLLDSEARELSNVSIFTPYVPRVMFFSPTGNFLSQFTNHCIENENLCYYYGDPKALLKTMTEVLHAFPPRPEYV
ncbi:thioredoxin domain-containing protein 12-like [Cimex lectularius]|uniref:Thioredoxin domain-containing protein n=1 Tax=Cimex lectularius TaxID=79782 RepID=A0A8I6TFV4_CIMLE|nr:thioredoxin domain-containing protein 12-like [Cimex lectularius]XP_014253189.1 thioredoxin domain-containing protein 12-like [Cimex lectularius]